MGGRPIPNPSHHPKYKKALIGNSNTKQTDTLVSKKAGFRLPILNFCTKTIKNGGKMMKYRKKPVVIEAIQLSNLSNQKIKECLEFMGQEVKSDEITQIKFQDYCDMVNDNGGMSIHTLEGVMNAPVGWFIIKGVKGEFYPCKPDIFEQTYEPVE